MVVIGAHGTVNALASSLFGSRHGVPQARHCGGTDEGLSVFASPQPHEFMCIGIRDVDGDGTEQKCLDTLRSEGCSIYTVSDVQGRGIRSILDEVAAAWGPR